MGKKEEEQRLLQCLTSWLDSVHETYQIVDQSPTASAARVTWEDEYRVGDEVSTRSSMVSWEDVIKIGDRVSKEATSAAMMCVGEIPGVGALEEKMSSYFTVLQQFILVSLGNQVGAGPTLSSSIHSSTKHVVDCSFRLWKECVSLYGTSKKDQKLSIPQLAGTVWEACSDLKKVPPTNITAIGRAMTQVAVSIKDVLREMKDLKPADAGSTGEGSDEASGKPVNVPEDNGGRTSDDDEGDLGNDLSPEEMEIAQTTIRVVSDTLAFMKELIRCITNMLKLEKRNEKSPFVESLEKLLQRSKVIGGQIDELGACVYPPQEVRAMTEAIKKIFAMIGDIQGEVESVEGSSEAFLQSCNGLRSSLKQLEDELDCPSISHVTNDLQTVTLSN